METTATIGGVLGDAWGSFRRRLATHAAWNAVFLGIAIAGVCGLMCVLVPIGAFAGIISAAAGGRGGEPPSVLVLAIVAISYVLLFIGMLVLMAWHQGTVCAITRADLSGEPIDAASARRAAAPRLVTLTGALFLRLVTDYLVAIPMCGVVYAVGFGGFSRDLRDSPTALAGVMGAFVLAYSASFAWVIASRGFFGLSGPVAQAEEVGALAAMRRSFELLEGHRLRMIGLRLVWAVVAFVLYMLAYAPLLLITVLLRDVGQLSLLLSLSYSLVFYYFALHVLSFDSAIEAAFYVRLTRGQSVEAIASVFE